MTKLQILIAVIASLASSAATFALTVEVYPHAALCEGASLADRMAADHARIGGQLDAFTAEAKRRHMLD